jgi:hypothetical protein
MAERIRWIEHIKKLRSKHGVDIFEAERLALSESHWRRWVAHQINNDVRCKRMALDHIRIHGDKSLLYEDGEVLLVR